MHVHFFPRLYSISRLKPPCIQHTHILFASVYRRSQASIWALVCRGSCLLLRSIVSQAHVQILFLFLFVLPLFHTTTIIIVCFVLSSLFEMSHFDIEKKNRNPVRPFSPLPTLLCFRNRFPHHLVYFVMHFWSCIHIASVSIYILFRKISICQ